MGGALLGIVVRCWAQRARLRHAKGSWTYLFRMIKLLSSNLFSSSSPLLQLAACSRETPSMNDGIDGICVQIRATPYHPAREEGSRGNKPLGAYYLIP